jgi:pilus assembly protein Flp/PilA
MTNLVKNYINDESGATAIEYGLIAALVGVALIVGAQRLGTSINTKFGEVADSMDAAS